MVRRVKRLPDRRPRGPRRIRPSLAAGLALVLAAVAAPARAGPPPAGDPLAPARKVVVAKLEALATWCDGNKMPGERDRTFRRILVFDPDHARSRAGLHFKRASRTAPWVQDDYVEPADWDKSLLPEARKRRIAAARAFRVAAAEAYDAAGVAPGAGRREEAAEISLDLAPEDEDFHRERGDVQDGGAWVLPETAAGRRRRAEFKERLGRLPPGGFAEDPEALAHHWTGGARSDHFDTYGHVPTEECLQEVRLRERGLEFLRFVLGPVEPRKDRHPLVLFPDYRTARRFLASKVEWAPLLKESELLGSMPLDDTIYLSWQEPDERRVVGLRNLVSHALRTVTKVHLRAWTVEGVGQRICRHVSGRHGACFCNVAGTDRPSDADVEDDVRTLDAVSSWIHPAAAVLRHEPVRRLRAVLTMNLNAMHGTDLVVAYALGAYLLEARPEALQPMITATAGEDDADKACRAALGVDVETLAWRLRRWAAETGKD
jgi:hypothetical protein